MGKDTAKRPRGRPLQGSRVMTPVMIRFPSELLDEIDAQIAGRLDRPDRSGVIRELIAEALEARAGKAKGGR
jgi:metal-responsive CopG/Arc/MetJ family transcriptional regulator